MNESSSNRTFVIGDVHGCSRLLSRLVDKLTTEWLPTDTLVFLGDYIDRGPDTKGVIEQLLELRDSSDGPECVFLRGNHEQWLQNARNGHDPFSWLAAMKGIKTIRSYSRTTAKRVWKHFKSGHTSSPDEMFADFPASHLAFLCDDLQDYYETNDLICVHAGLMPGIPLAEQDEKDLFWTHPADLIDNWQGPKTLIVGHKDTVSVDSSCKRQPVIREHMICLDTGSNRTGCLSAIMLPERRIFQVKGFRV